MAPLAQAEKDALTSQILQDLAGTPYACSSLTKLTNGTTNFVSRGLLNQPLHDGTALTTKSIIVKHSTNFAAVNQDFPLDISRCVHTRLHPGLALEAHRHKC